jgi:outer membrane protein OmpA-like peptidoglycan-associated protein
MQNDDDRKEDGSIWTSYSDLFTTVAVIFLVMFVFALVKAGVSKMQQVVEKNRHEQELKGKVSEKNKQQTNQKIVKVESTLHEMTAYEDLVNTKMKEMNDFVVNLQKNKKVMHDLIEDQKRKEAQLEVVHEVVKNYENEIENRRQKQNELEQKLEEKIAELLKKHEQVDKQIAQVAKLEIEVTEKENRIEKLTEKNQKMNEALVEKNKLAEAINLEKEQRQFKINELENSIHKLKIQSELEVNKLTKTLEEKKQEDIKLKMELKERQTEIVALTQKNELIRNDNFQKQEEIENQRRKLAESDKNLKNQVEQLNKLKQEQTLQTAHLKKIESEIKNVQEQNVLMMAQNEKLTTLNKQLVDQKDQMEKTSHELKLVNNQLLYDRGQKESQIKELIVKNDSYQKIISDKNIDIQTLNASLANSRAKMAGLEEQLKLSQKSIAEAQNETKNVRQNMEGLKQAYQKAKQNSGQHSRKIASVAQEIEDLKILNQEKEQELLSCQNEKEGAFKTNEHLKESLSDFATKVANVKGKLRSSIAEELAQAFTNAKLNVMVDKKSGNIVFLMDENFRFEKNSAYLNKAARNTLNKIIPIYSKVLFGNKGIKDKIAGFNIVGHASPSHGGKYVEPTSDNVAAYSYNMKLSAERAASVANYIFSQEIGNYQHKVELKEFTSSIGQGFTKPIKTKGRALASQSACGPYDCHASQRVEISFTLKDDVESINKLIQMAKDIK